MAADTPLAALLRELRDRQLMTQEDLARRAGLSVGTVRGLESGRISRPRSATVRALVEVLAGSDDDRRRFITAAHGDAPISPAPRTDDDTESRVDAGGPPRQLPREASWFTGRTAELEHCWGWCPTQGGRPRWSSARSTVWQESARPS
jgi:transcriptional regulator with XRE-family HTH domain